MRLQRRCLSAPPRTPTTMQTAVAQIWHRRLQLSTGRSTQCADHGATSRAGRPARYSATICSELSTASSVAAEVCKFRRHAKHHRVCVGQAELALKGAGQLLPAVSAVPRAAASALASRPNDQSHKTAERCEVPNEIAERGMKPVVDLPKEVIFCVVLSSITHEFDRFQKRRWPLGPMKGVLHALRCARVIYADADMKSRCCRASLTGPTGDVGVLHVDATYTPQDYAEYAQDLSILHQSRADRHFEARHQRRRCLRPARPGRVR